MDIHAITQLRREWEYDSRSRRAQILLEKLTALEPDLAAVGAGSLSELYATAQSRGSGCHLEPWRLTAALLRQFELNDLVGVGLLANLRPGMLMVGRRLEWGKSAPWQDAQAFGCDLVETTWEVLGSLVGSTVAYPERTVLRLARQHLESQRSAARRRQSREVPLQCDLDWIDPKPLPVLEELALALRVRRAEITPRDHDLIHAHRILGLTFPELAASMGASVEALEQRCHRAEAALCA